MEVNGATSMAAREAYLNKAETDKQILDKTLAKTEETERVAAKKEESQKEYTNTIERQAEGAGETESGTQRRVDFRV